MCASKITTPSRDTDRWETVFVEGKCVVMVRNSPGDRKGKFIAEESLSKPGGPFLQNS
jgi:hypothetical protein